MNPSPKALQQMYRLRTNAQFPALIEITHADIPGGVIRLVNSDENMTYLGYVYLASCFKYTPPKYNDKKMGDGSITISAIDSEIILVIRNLFGRAKAVVTASFYYDNGAILFEPIEEWKFDLASVSWDGSAATWQMKYDTRMDIVTPCDKMTAQKCPGVA